MGGNVTLAVLLIIAFAIALFVHEGNHALVATALGDDTPRRAGRLSLNPLRHIDKAGMVIFIIAGFGWASTPVNPYKLRPNPRLGNAIVAAAGPIANLLLAFLAWSVLKMYSEPTASGIRSDNLARFLFIIVQLNLLLFCFNLIPLPPLDGFSVLMGVLPSKLAAMLKPLERYGPPLLLALLVLPAAIGFDLIGIIFRFVSRLFFGI